MLLRPRPRLAVDCHQHMTGAATAGGAALSVEEALDLAGFGAFQWRLFVVCGLGWSADVAEIRLIGFLLNEGVLGWRTTAAERSALSAVMFVGMMSGALIWGVAADALGRKPVFTATCAL